MKYLLFLPGITDLKLEKIGKEISPFVKGEMGFLMVQKMAVISIEDVKDTPPELLIQLAMTFTKNPVFLVDAARIAFTMTNEECLALFDKDFPTLQEEMIKRHQQNIDIDEFEDDDDEIGRIIRENECKVDEIDLDNVLDKISSNGFDSLNKKEKKFLKNYGK